MSRSTTVLPFLFLLVAIPAAAAPSPIPVVACGQVVPTAMTAMLTGDLDCAGSDFGVILQANARLLLGGHTLSNASVAAVECTKNCRVTGPGVITGSLIGISGSKGIVRVKDAEIAENASGSTATAKRATSSSRWWHAPTAAAQTASR